MQANLTGVMCTLLPQCAEAPIQQSQDKADDYGLNRQQQGCLQKGRDIIVINCNGTYFGWFIIRSLSQFSTPVTSIYINLSHTRLSVCHCQFTHTDTKELDLYGLINPQLCVRGCVVFSTELTSYISVLLYTVMFISCCTAQFAEFFSPPFCIC